MTDAAAVHKKAADLGNLAVRMTTLAGSGHASSALSLAHVVVHLMYERMRYDPARPLDPAADRLVLSEGHAVPIVYAAWADLGGAVGKDGPPRPLTVRDLDELRARDSVLDGHPNPAEGVPIFDAATGSLGQGLSVGAGLALAARLDRTPRQVYVLIGDGESREGQVWEAADFVIDHRLTNVCAFFNCNGQGQAGDVSPAQSADRLAAKLAAFGWEVATIDGHDPAAVAAAFDRAGRGERPLAIVGRTIKGWGVDALLKGNWHGKPLAEADLDAANQSLLRRVPAGAKDLGRPTPRPAAEPATPRVDPREIRWPSFSEAMQATGFAAAVQKNALGTRKAYGAALKIAGDLVPQVVCLDGDVSNSTFTDVFAKAHPTRFFECKIAEQNMLSAAAGLAAAGFIPFANSFAKFLMRACDQIDLASISRANIKIVGSHAGISLAADGPSQMGLSDVAYFAAFTTARADDRVSPLAWLFHPADAVAAYECTRLMLQVPGMCFMRTHRPDTPLLYDAKATFTPRGFNVLSTGSDAALIGSGYTVHEALRAAALLARQNIRVSVIDAYCLPIDGPRLLETLNSCGRRALVVEDNFGGGFGSVIAGLAARAGGLRVGTLSVQRLPKSARTSDETLEYCGVGAGQVADQLRALLGTGR